MKNKTKTIKILAASLFILTAFMTYFLINVLSITSFLFNKTNVRFSGYSYDTGTIRCDIYNINNIIIPAIIALCISGSILIILTVQVSIFIIKNIKAYAKHTKIHIKQVKHNMLEKKVIKLSEKYNDAKYKLYKMQTENGQLSKD